MDIFSHQSDILYTSFQDSLHIVEPTLKHFVLCVSGNVGLPL